MKTVDDIREYLNEQALEETIQQMIADLKATQHGDETNPLYDVLTIFHLEGGVWKHTKLAVDALPNVARDLSANLNDPEYQELYNKHLNTLRSAALFHDIGKIATQTPSTKRPGSYSFPEHPSEEVVDKLFQEYDITPSSAVRDLVVHHHDSPKDISALRDQGWESEALKLLIILKAADNVAVGPRGTASAVQHVRPFVDAMGEEPTVPADRIDREELDVLPRDVEVSDFDKEMQPFARR